MKTKALEKKLAEYGYRVVEDKYHTYITNGSGFKTYQIKMGHNLGDITIAKGTPDNIVRYSLDYYYTPLEEREEKKIYDVYVPEILTQGYYDMVELTLEQLTKKKEIIEKDGDYYLKLLVKEQRE